MTKKFTCFADETGQDTKGVFFLVVTCVIDSEDKDELEQTLIQIELNSNKGKRKWSKSSNEVRLAYLKELFKSKFPIDSISYAVYRNSLEYAYLLSYTIAKAILKKTSTDIQYSAKIFFDRINKKTEEQVKKELKKLKIRYKKIRGLKDESMALIRLTDSIAGYMRDLLEDKPYLKEMSLKRRIYEL